MVYLLSGFSAVMAGDRSLGQLEISFDYNRATRDYANNQFAVWVEDMQGNLVTTLFVTQFTATKGWKIRKEALPTWKKKVNISKRDKKELDAISGATPKAGRLVYRWKEENSESSFLVPGSYRYFVECNLYWENTVLYSGTIRASGKSDISKAVAAYSTEKAKEYNIIENVIGRFVPLP